MARASVACLPQSDRTGSSPRPRNRSIRPCATNRCSIARGVDGVEANVEASIASWRTCRVTGQHSKQFHRKGRAVSKRDDIPDLKRRDFFKGATLAGAAALSAPFEAAAQNAPPRAGVAPPNRAAETAVPPALEVLTEGRSGSDFMVDCLKSLGFEYIAANPASSFRGLHESLINYGGNRQSGIPHLLARGNLGRDGAWLLQDRGQAARHIRPRHRRAPARHHGDVQCLVRPRAGLCGGRQRPRRADAAARRRVEPHRAGRRRHRPRLRQVGRLSGLAPALRRIRGARLQIRHDAADGCRC